MLPPALPASNGPGGQLSSSNLRTVLNDFEPPVADIISRSVITSSFNAEERFEWSPSTGFRVSIPDRFSFVPFERATADEIRSRLSANSRARDQKGHSVLQSKLPERSVAWWFAQLIHYGLPIASDRDQAKESFRIATAQDRLFVPQRLRDLEIRLKRKYVVTPGDRSGLPTTVREQPVMVSSNGAKTQNSIQKKQDKLQAQSEKSKPQDKHDGGDSDSSSDSESEMTPKPAHLFTPYGARITRPAEYPGLADNTQAERRRQDVMRDLQKKAAKKSTLSRETRRTMNSELELHLSDRVESNENPSDESIRSDTDVENLEGDSADETGSIQFYTPLQYLKHRPDREDDQESVVFAGFQPKPKGEGRQKRDHASKKPEIGTSGTRIKIEPSQSDTRKTKSVKVEDPPARGRKSSAKKPQKSAQEQIKNNNVTKVPPKSSNKRRRIIEISSDSDTDSNLDSNSTSDNNDTEIATRPSRAKIRPKNSRNFTDGSREISGGFHGASKPIEKSPKHSRSTQSQTGPSPATGNQESASESDLPSMTELFSSQQTPESWKTAMNRAKTQRAAVKKSYDPDSVPALREQLATLPAYLKTSVRHDTPELPRSSPMTQVARPTSKARERSRSESVNMLPVQRKRARPSMIEIEAESSQPSLFKRPRMSAPQSEPASTALDIFNVEPQVKSPGSNKNRNSRIASERKHDTKKNKANTLTSRKAGVDNASQKSHNRGNARRRAKSVGVGRKSVEL